MTDDGSKRTTGAALIVAERQRQIDVEGYDGDHDFGAADDLAVAGACYALPQSRRAVRRRELIGDNVKVTVTVALWGELWPWGEAYWKPSDDRRRELVKAGALIAAAIDALP